MLIPRWLTGGRPMRRLSFGFIDIVSGKTVCYYIDRYDRLWMAEWAWGRFRVPVENREVRRFEEIGGQ